MAKKTAEVTEKVVESGPVKLIRMDLRIIDMTVVGDSGLICNRWSEKAKKQMRDKQMKRAKDAKEAKDPEECFKGSLYEYPGGGHGFPAIAFKAAAVDACSHVDGITKVLARGAFHIIGDLVKRIRYNARVLSEDQILNLFEIAGFAIGVGEHRPQRDGSNGMFSLKRSA
jgi:hypothetical protein